MTDIFYARREKKLSVRELSDITGISQQIIVLIESGAINNACEYREEKDILLRVLRR